MSEICEKCQSVFRPQMANALFTPLHSFDNLADSDQLFYQQQIIGNNVCHRYIGISLDVVQYAP